ncbi:hypothetical protein J4440_00920 [Candidatus Woesearchaeota archaeon]|nr:hypothetical protein [Candidatus Woesearchaeota archaeon]
MLCRIEGLPDHILNKYFPSFLFILALRSHAKKLNILTCPRIKRSSGEKHETKDLADRIIRDYLLYHYDRGILNREAPLTTINYYFGNSHFENSFDCILDRSNVYPFEIRLTKIELKYPDIFVNRMRRQFILVSEKIIKMDNEKYHKFMKELMQRDTLFFV